MTKYFILAKSYDKLENKAATDTQLYYDDNSYGRKQISDYETKKMKKIEPDEVEIDGQTYELAHEDVELEKFAHKKPHQAVKKSWNDRVEQLKQFIHEQEVILDKYVNEDLKGIRTNLFVDPQYANVVETKITELRKTLATLNLRLDKLKDHYENVRDTTIETENEKKGSPTVNWTMVSNVS